MVQQVDALAIPRLESVGGVATFMTSTSAGSVRCHNSLDLLCRATIEPQRSCQGIQMRGRSLTLCVKEGHESLPVRTPDPR